MPSPTPRRSESGFTLVESMVAIVVLIFGLMAVTNLLLVAASSNTVANQGTAAAIAASERMDLFRTMPFATLLTATGGDITSTVAPTVDCRPAGGAAVPLPPAAFSCSESIPGVGTIFTRWQISNVAGTSRALYIQVRSEGTGALSGARSRADFTTLRTCTDSTAVLSPDPATACPQAP